jgi:hypothetical protein
VAFPKTAPPSLLRSQSALLPGSVTRILGKATFWFQYGDVKVHPTSYSDILEIEKAAEEFQIIQT